MVSRAPGRIVVDLDGAKGGVFLQLRRTNPTNHVRDVRVLMPGFERTYRTQVFHPAFLDRWKDFNTFRFMDWVETNGSKQRNWSERPKPDGFTWTEKGVPVEVMVDLCNRLKVNPWFTLPHLATDDYVRQFARLVKARLDPALKVYVEYSNEIWNGMFAQMKYAETEGQRLGFGEKPWEAGWRFSAHRSGQIHRLWEEEFGGRGPIQEVDRAPQGLLIRRRVHGVRRTGGGYQIVVGERRWRAAKFAGLERIPALIRESTDAESLELALVENLLREDLNPMEEAEAYQRLIADYSWTQEELASRVGKDRSSIANGLRLLRLPASIQADLRAGRLTMGHARALLSLESEADQLRLRDQILAHSWSVRATEEGVKTKRSHLPGRAPRRSPELDAVEDTLREALATRVRLVGSERRGRIEIAYTSREDLDRITEMLCGGRR